ncbi:hypothetical protein F5148DRAFT_496358 [Russula earlei]|uniref:Uncharacterized protein n=1 Tax=Russula earlei TaxID=71964 RepID=A0ACC0TXN6_9AGAM|nr:hypothetical protein F5148DRAFT_496358 [Russula earlei]
MPVLIVTFLFSKARRDATLINLGITIMLSSICNCLLLYAHEYLGPEPNKRLCIFQAAAFGANAPMCAVAALTLVIQIRSRLELKNVRWLPFMLLAPYLVFIAFFVANLIVGSRRPDTVTRARRTFYCSVESRTLSLVSIGFTSVAALIAVGGGAMLSFHLYNFLRIVRKARRPQIRVIPLAIRLVLFMVYLFFALVTSLWSIHDQKTFIRDIYISTFGVAYFLAFGTQRDVFRAWCFLRGRDDSRVRTETTATDGQTPEAITMLQVPATGSVVSTICDAGAAHEEASPALSPVRTPFAHAHYAAKSVHILVTSTRTEA